MYDFLSENNLIYNRQFGFRKNYSTNHALISLNEDLKSCRDNGGFTAGIFIDLEKAFDTVNHKILSDKLLYYGFRGVTHKLLMSFLSNRSQYVSIHGFDSNILPTKCGVPQGSTLGPILFLLYINDLRFSLKNTSSNHFADDTCIIYANNFPNLKMKTFETVLNTELKSTAEWLKSNRLSLNEKKSKLLIYHSKRKKIDYKSFSIKLNNVKLNPELNVKYLGMLIDKFLSWDDHIHNLGKTLSRSNGILSKLRHYLPKETLISVYYATFHSYLIYGCLNWSQANATSIEKINILQKKCLRIINFAPYNSHSPPLFKQCKILRVNDIIKIEKIIFAYKFITDNLPIDLRKFLKSNTNIYNTRNMSNRGLSIPKINTVLYGRNSLRFSIPKEWNDFIKNHNIQQIKTSYSLKKLLKSEILMLYT